MSLGLVEQRENCVRAARRVDRFPELGRHDGSAYLAPLGEEYAAAQQAHRSDDLRHVRSRVGDGETLVIHRRSVPSRLNVQQDSAYNSWVTSLRQTETRHHPEGKTCHHYAYHRLTCDEYDALRARAGGRCEICGTPEEDTPRGYLLIDHFAMKRIRFIRGLICGKCNSGVMPCVDGRKVWGVNRQWEAKAREYEANSWQKPNEAALAVMATRTEMLSKFDPRYEQPKRQYVPPRRVPAYRRPKKIQIPLHQGPGVIAQRLRKHLSERQIERLAALLSEK